MSHETDPNPLLDLAHPIAFDQIGAAQVRPAAHNLLDHCRGQLEALEQDSGPRTYDNTLAALEELTLRLGRCMTVVGHLESVATTPELRDAYNEIQPHVSAFFSALGLSEKLYAQVKRFAETDEAKNLDATRRRLLDKTLESFEREGAALPAADKVRLNALNVELAETTTRFSQNVLDDTNAFELLVDEREELAGLPERALSAAREAAAERGHEGYRFTLQAPSFIPLMTHVDSRRIRETVYRAFYARASRGEHDNRELLRRILDLRRERASLLGYDSFVDLVLDDRMAKKGERAQAFVTDLRDRSQLAFERENQELVEFRKQALGAQADALRPWDVGYWAEKQREARYDFDEEQLRPYFPLEGVLSGLFDLVNRLYGIVVERVEEMPVWHESVRTYRITDADGEVLGTFYADFFPRESKRDGAWMNAFLTGLQQESGRTPHVGLICLNVTPPSGNTPPLLGHREVETVFHEFGHLLHHMLTEVPIRSLAGTNVAWDFVELPSQIMENWCWEKESLDLFARHYQTAERIAPELFDKLRRARTYRGANAMMRQLGFASLDLGLHMSQPGVGSDPVTFGRELMAAFTPTELGEDFAMVTSFGHLFSHPVGYAGGYYSYKWAEVLDADAFSRFAREGLFSRKVGLEFRNKILARGDSRDPMELFTDFMGREPDLEPLLERSGVKAGAQSVAASREP